MRWVSYTAADGGPRAGLVHGDEIHGLPAPTRVLDLLGDDGTRMAEAAERALADPVEVLPYAGAVLLPPVAPPAVRDFLTFLDHMRVVQDATGVTMSEVWEQIPFFYFSNPAAVVGPHDPVAISPGCSWFDFELEVAAIIGRAGRDLDPETATEHIAGFTVFNDWSARDLQLHEMKLNSGPAKGKDGANTLGPMLVTPDELEPHRSGGSYRLRMSAHVNGEYVGGGLLDQMDWTWGEMLAYASRGTTLRPGDALGSGTVPTGCLIEHFATAPDTFRGWLRPGDVVRLEVEQLGAIEQRVLPAPPVHRLRTGF
ncbi:fumarylacetoacetate hydrolase family protein [Pseudonocardia sp. RS010]|uniref:fumarylacetoacetate hydrolase family protein n=1 Tax=Pseudonocardia sp. RS010 TaxID=3385979 RepID=UPI00399F956F